MRQTQAMALGYLGAQAYAGGSVLVTAGEQLQDLGGAWGVGPLQQAGRAVADLGRAEQSLATEEQRRFVQVSTEAEAYVVGLGFSSLGQALEDLGAATGWAGLMESGQGLQTAGRNIQEATSGNPLVAALQDAVAERGREYEEDSWFAVPRDVTRALLEVASFFVGPEDLLARAATGGRAARAGRGPAGAMSLNTPRVSIPA
ncbi:MAG: hypothetical protein HY655_08925 [Acidobacteria bacterium]|nr:hypothetical protein [Acidobacteriota bacterium]